MCLIRGRTQAGVGGIFYDDMNTGDWAGGFCLYAIDVGRAFLAGVSWAWSSGGGMKPFDAADREVQLVHRGLYAEYNLVYDRGTKFGLETGHDANAVLMSLPPDCQMDLRGRAACRGHRAPSKPVSCRTGFCAGAGPRAP